VIQLGDRGIFTPLSFEETIKHSEAVVLLKHRKLIHLVKFIEKALRPVIQLEHRADRDSYVLFQELGELLKNFGLELL
jgi:predicted transposase YdaD